FDSQGKIESRTLPGNPDDLVAKYSVEFIEFTFAVGTCGQRDRPVRVQMVDLGIRQKGVEGCVDGCRNTAIAKRRQRIVIGNLIFGLFATVQPLEVTQATQI